MGTATMRGAVPEVIGSFGNQIFTAMVLFLSYLVIQISEDRSFLKHIFQGLGCCLEILLLITTNRQKLTKKINIFNFFC